jgi:hypothetical protein
MVRDHAEDEGIVGSGSIMAPIIGSSIFRITAMSSSAMVAVPSPARLCVAGLTHWYARLRPASTFTSVIPVAMPANSGDLRTGDCR